MFFRVLAAMVTADAFDRRMREQQRRAWLAQDQLRRSGPAAPMISPRSAPPDAQPAGWDSAAPERRT